MIATEPRHSINTITMSPTQELKLTILENWIESLQYEKLSSDILRDRARQHTLNSPDEIREYEQQKELDRIKFGGR